MRIIPDGERHGTHKRGEQVLPVLAGKRTSCSYSTPFAMKPVFSAVPWLMAGLIHLPVQLSSLLANFPLLHN